MKISLFILVFIPVFMLMFKSAIATEYNARSQMWFISMLTCEDYSTQTACLAYGCYWYDSACHTNPQPSVGIDICHEIIQIGDETLCMTDEGNLILVTTATIGLLAIPVSKKIGEKYE